MTGPSFRERAAAAQRGDYSLLTDRERASVVRGEGLPRPRLNVVVPDHPVPGRTARGLSREALYLFETAQKTGGVFDLAELKMWARVQDMDALVAELVEAGLVERLVLPPSNLRPLEDTLAGAARPQQPRIAIRVLPAYEDAIVSSHGRGWSRWT
jgi:hypothetical protein